MKLRTKFVLLVIGVAVIPFLTIAFSIIINLGTSTDDIPIGKRLETQYWGRIGIPLALRRGNLDKALGNLPQQIDMIVLDSGRRIVYSSDAGKTEGTVMTELELADYLQNMTERYDLNIRRYKDMEGQSGYVITKNPSEGPVHSPPRALIGLSIPVILMAFTLAMAITIIRSIERSISVLADATRRIAQGNLDFKLEARGNDQIASLTRSFATMQENLKEEYARRARFIMGVSHDLKTPLSLIQGYLDAIVDGYAREPEKLEHFLSIIKDKTALLESRIVHLIDFVKIETREWKLNFDNVQLSYFLLDLTRRYREESSVLGFHFSSSVQIDPGVQVKMDPELITRAFDNLFHNALRYSDAGTEIDLTAQPRENRIEVTLTNRGKPIPQDELPYLFDMFYRGSYSRNEAGFGLGLANVKSILSAHGWDVTASSSPGADNEPAKTSFQVGIPVNIR